MHTLRKNLPFLVLLADFSLIVRIGIVESHIQPYELFILLASLIAVILMCSKQNDPLLAAEAKRNGYWFGIGVGLTVLGIAGAFVAYGQDRIPPLLFLLPDAFLLWTLFLGFTFHSYFGRTYEFRKKALFLLSLTPIIFLPFLVIPQIRNALPILGGNDFFTGLHNNQNATGTFLLVPLAFFIHLLLDQKQLRYKAGYLAMLIITFSFILWTGSRGAWVSAAAILLLYLIHYTARAQTIKRKLLLFVEGGAIILCAAFISFLLLPYPTKILALDRVFPAITDHKPGEAAAEGVSIESSLATIKKSAPSVTAYQNRENLWPQAIKTLAKNPFGLGPEYSRISKVFVEKDGRLTAAHNSYLQAGLIGGIGLLALILWGMTVLFRKLYALPKDSERALLLILCTGLLISITFNDYFYALPWVWIVLGLATAKIQGATSTNVQNRNR